MNKKWISHKILNAKINAIIRHYKPEKIILFGSVANVDTHEGSDVDLLIIKKTRQEFLKRIDAVLRFFHGEFAVDVLVYRPDEIDAMLKEGNDFIATVLRTGRVLYEKPERKRM